MEGEIKVSNLLKKDISQRVLSVLLAVLLWFIVSNSVNPIKRTTLTVPLTIINRQALQDNGIVITNEKYTRNVLVTVEARENIIKNLTANDFLINLDFSKVKSVSDTDIPIDAPVYIGDEDKKDIKIIEVKPTSIKVELGKQEKNSFKVDVESIGEPKKDYKIISKTTDPETISIEALDSQINMVGSVKTFVDVTGIDRDTVIKKDCKVYDKNGEEIPALSKGLSVNVKIQVAKEVPVVPDIKGTPAKNYVYGAVKVSPEKILITGAPEILDKIDSIKTEPVSIENSTESIDVTKKVILPNGVKYHSPVKDIEVQVTINQLANKDFIISGNEIDMLNMAGDNSLSYSIVNESITITLRGDRAVLDSLDVSGLRPSVDVKGLDAGIHRVPLRLILPSSVYLAQDYFVEVRIDSR